MRITRFGFAVLLLIGLAALARVTVMQARPMAQSNAKAASLPAIAP